MKNEEIEILTSQFMTELIDKGITTELVNIYLKEAFKIGWYECSNYYKIEEGIMK